MTTPEMLDPPRAEPDYEMADDVAEFARIHASELAAADRAVKPIRSEA